MRTDANAAKVKAVGIPTGHNRRVGFGHAEGVALDSKFKQFQVTLSKVKIIWLQNSHDQLCCTDAVEKVNIFIFPADIVQESKILHHFHIRAS